MGAIAYQITSLAIVNVYSIIYSDADQRKHQSNCFGRQLTLTFKVKFDFKKLKFSGFTTTSNSSPSYNHQGAMST